jgi:hypothetical protein
MGAIWLKSRLLGCEMIVHLEAESDQFLTLRTRSTVLGGKSETVRVYCPTRDEYEVNQDMIDRAVANGANAIVGDTWCMIHTGMATATSGTRIMCYKARDFISRYE